MKPVTRVEATELILVSPVPLSVCYTELPVPASVAQAGPSATERFLEFFAAQIRNPNTRLAYARAIRDFFRWTEARGLSLSAVRSLHVAAYIEQLHLAAPTVKQHLAAIRMLFDWLVRTGVLPTNPAAVVRGPKHVVKVGKTPVLNSDEARELLESISVDSIAGPRSTPGRCPPRPLRCGSDLGLRPYRPFGEALFGSSGRVQSPEHRVCDLP